jgi:hypothetical protein
MPKKPQMRRKLASILISVKDNHVLVNSSMLLLEHVHAKTGNCSDFWDSVSFICF